MNRQFSIEDLQVSMNMKNVINLIVTKEIKIKIIMNCGFCLFCFAHMISVKKDWWYPLLESVWSNRYCSTLLVEMLIITAFLSGNEYFLVDF